MQLFVLHEDDSDEDPEHPLPPWYGPFLDLERVMVPESQVFEQEVQDPQVFQVQSTENHCHIIIIKWTFILHVMHGIWIRSVLIDLIFTRAAICIAWSWLGWWSRAIASTIIWPILGSWASLGSWATCLCTWAPRSRVPCAVHWKSIPYLHTYVSLYSQRFFASHYTRTQL